MKEKGQVKTPYYYESIGGDEKRITGFGIRHLQVAMMSLSIVILYIVRSSMGVAILPMTNTSRIDIKTYDWDTGIQNVILSSFFWGYTVMQVPGSILAKKFGGKATVLTALVLTSVLCLSVPTIAELGGWRGVCAVRIIMGLTQACLFPSNHTLLSHWVLPEERTMFAGIVYGGAHIGTIIAMPICGSLASTSLGWVLIFYFMSALTMTFAVFWYFLSASYPSEHRFISEGEKKLLEMTLSTGYNQEGPLKVPWKSFATSVPFWAILVLHIGVNWLFTIFFVEIPSYLRTALKLSEEMSSSLSALPFVSLYMMGILTTNVSQKVTNKKILTPTIARKSFIIIGGTLSISGLITMSYLGPNQATLAVILLIISCGFYSIPCSLFVVNHMDLSPNYAGILFALTNCIGNAISAAAPITAGLILNPNPEDILRWRIVFSIASGVFLTSCLVFTIFGSAEIQPWNNMYKKPIEMVEKNIVESIENGKLNGVNIEKKETTQ